METSRFVERVEATKLEFVEEKDKAGSCIRYNRAWHKNTDIPLKWIMNAGHNSNTDQPEIVNNLIEKFLRQLK